MFRNYQELFHGYVEFYKTSLYGSVEAAMMVATTGSTSTPTPNSVVRVKRQALMDEYEDESSSYESAVEPMLQLTANQSSSSSSAADCNSLKTTTNENLLHERQNSAHGRLTLTLDEPSGKVVRIGEFNGLEVLDIVHMTTVFILLMLAKRFLSRKLSSYKRIDQLGLRQKDRERLDECIWRLFYYSFSSTWLIYSCLKNNSHLLLFAATTTTTTNHELPQALTTRYTFELDWSSYTIFIIEAAFYVHATYAILFEDVWRRDSPMMLVHHLAAVFSTLSIYATR